MHPDMGKRYAIAKRVITSQAFHPARKLTRFCKPPWPVIRRILVHFHILRAGNDALRRSQKSPSAAASARWREERSALNT
jgi:hypothetical protein